MLSIVRQEIFVKLEKPHIMSYYIDRMENNSVMRRTNPTFIVYFLGLEAQLGPVVAAISKNKSIRKLSIGRNLNNIKSKHVYHVMESVVQMIQVRFFY